MLVDDKALNIISTLLDNEALRVDDITSLSKMSKRNVYYVLSDINDLLENEGLDRIKSGYGRGLSLDDSQRKYLLDIYEKYRFNTQQTLSFSERVAIIYCVILFSRRRVLVKYLEDIMQYSRFTILNDISALKEELIRFEIVLEYSKKEGYHLIGDVVATRKAYFYFFSSISHMLLDDGRPSPFSAESVKRAHDIFDKFTEFELEYNNKYFEASLLAISVLISQIEVGVSNYYNKLELMDDSFEYEHTAEYEFITNSFNLCASECQYFTLYLVASRVDSNIIVQEKEIILSRSIIEKFNTLTGLRINDSNFEYKLAKHLAIAQMRYKYEIAVDNPLIAEIKANYRECFDILKETSILLKQDLGGVLTENEIGFLTLYFAGYLLDNDSFDLKVKVLVICVNGTSTSYLLTRELIQLDSRIEIVNFTGVSDLSTYDNMYDLIISTIELEDIAGPYLKVNPILTVEDRTKIIDKISEINIRSSERSVLNEHGGKEVLEINEQTSKLCLSEVEESKKQSEGYKEVMKKDFVQLLTPGDMTWSDVITYACDPLLRAGYIEASFITQLIENINDYGPYMIYRNRYLLGHAKLENSVKLGVSATVLSNPIEIYNEIVEKIIIISYTDFHNHLHIIDNLYEIFQNNALDNYIKSIESTDKLFEVLYMNIFK